ncbi:MAG: aminotransferase class IV family protein [Bacteroidota bacterium]
MSPYIETIRLQDGVLRNLGYHQDRLERTRSRELGLSTHPRLKEIIQVPDGLERGLFKCRILYGQKVERIEYEPHFRRRVSSLKVVHCDKILYTYKSSDRSKLEELFAKRGRSDDILIVKEGSLSDSYYANTAFWDGRAWFTPDTPLLAGTMRAFLMDQGLLREARITLDDLGKYQKIRLINALNDLTEGPEISMDRVIL